MAHIIALLKSSLAIRRMVRAYFAEICKNRDSVILVLHHEYSAYFWNISGIFLEYFWNTIHDACILFAY
jgi:hypothetical protein